jgi:hypothetical protein
MQNRPAPLSPPAPAKKPAAGSGVAVLPAAGAPAEPENTPDHADAAQQALAHAERQAQGRQARMRLNRALEFSRLPAYAWVELDTARHPGAHLLPQHLRQQVGEEIAQAGAVLAPFPAQHRRYLHLKKQGWMFRASAPGGGTYCARLDKRVFIDILHFAEPVTLARLLVNEMAHAMWEPENFFSIEQFIDKRILDEGNAIFCQFAMVDDAVDARTRREILESIGKTGLGRERLAVYENWKQAGKAVGDARTRAGIDQAARRAYGEIFQRLTPAGLPAGTSYRDVWEVGYRTWLGRDKAARLIDEVKWQAPYCKVINTIGQLATPSTASIQIAIRLPADVFGGQVVLVSKRLVERERMGRNAALFHGLVRMGLDHGEWEIVPASPLQKQSSAPAFTGVPQRLAQPGAHTNRRLVSRFSIGDNACEIHLEIDADGIALNLEVVDPAFTPVPADPTLATAMAKMRMQTCGTHAHGMKYDSPFSRF